MRLTNDMGNSDHPPEDGHLANELRTKRANRRRMHVGERPLRASASASRASSLSDPAREQVDVQLDGAMGNRQFVRHGGEDLWCSGGR